MPEQEADKQEQAEAINLTTSAQRLEVLSANPRLRSAVAGNPAAPARVLVSLAQDQNTQVRELVANNPNTPWSTLVHLAAEFPQAFLHNSIGLLYMLAHPGEVDTSSKFWDMLLQTAPIPSLWWNWLLSQPALSASKGVQLHVQYAGDMAHPYEVLPSGEDMLFRLVELLTAAWDQGVPLPSFPESSHTGHPVVAGENIVVTDIQWLAYHGNRQVRLAIAENHYIPAAVLGLLAHDEAWQVRKVVAGHPQTPIEALHTLARDSDPEVRRHITTNPRIPLELLQVLAQDHNASVRCCVARHSQTPGDVLQALAQDQDEAVRHIVAWRHPQMPGDVLLTLVRDDAFVEGALGCATPLEFLQALIWDHDKRMWHAAISHSNYALTFLKGLQQIYYRRDTPYWLARYPYTPTVGLEKLAQGEDIMYLDIMRNPHTPVDVLRLFARSRDAEIRQAVAAHLQTPIDILQALAWDDCRFVREAADWHLQMRAEALRILTQHGQDSVRGAATTHVRMPVAVLQTLVLSRDPDAAVRRYVAENLQMPSEILQSLALDEEEEVRRMVARNPQTPVEALRVLARDEDDPEWGEGVREIVAANLQTPVEVLQDLARDRNSSVREKVAWNRRTPPAVLRLLAGDQMEEVRTCVASHQQVPVDVLRLLAGDQAVGVREAVAWNPQTAPEVLGVLAQDESGWVREAVAGNPQTPVEMLHHLKKDQDTDVHWLATFILKLFVPNKNLAKNEPWWNQFRWYTQIRRKSPLEQLVKVAQLNVSDTVRQAMIEICAADWDISTIRAIPQVFGADVAALGRPWRAYYRLLLSPFLPAIALQKLSTSPCWEVRYLLALHPRTPEETRQRLSQDGNRYVRAMARACQYRNPNAERE